MDNATFLGLVEGCFAQLGNNAVELPSEGVRIPVLDAPLVGFAAADDPLFEAFKRRDVVGPIAMSPAPPCGTRRQKRCRKPTEACDGRTFGPALFVCVTPVEADGE